MAEELARIGDYVRLYARRTPDREAAVDRRRLTYRELALEVSAVRRALEQCGVEPGDRVACLDHPGLPFWTSFLATGDLGAMWLGLNPRYTEAELARTLRAARPRVIIARRRLDGQDISATLLRVAGAPDAHIWWLDEDQDRCPIDTTDCVDPGAGLTAVSPRTPCLLVYTSGTTGAPKGAMIHHHGLVHCSLVQNAQVGLGPSRVLCNLPINHIGCVGDLCATTLTAGGTLVFMPGFKPTEIPDTIARERIEVWGQVPTMFALTFSQSEFDPVKLGSLKAIRWGGAALPAGLLAHFRNLGVALGTDYGMTETTGSITFTRPDAPDEELLETVGRPAPGYSLRRMNDAGAPADGEQPGEVQVRGPWLMAGYFEDPEATRAAYTPDGWLRTGDIAVQRPDGTWRLVGRAKEMFKSGGYNVYPREVEQVLEAHPAVFMAAVIGVPDETYGEVGLAFVLPAAEVGAEALDAWCRTRLANFKVPKHIQVDPGLPMLPIGKIDKAALRLRI